MPGFPTPTTDDWRCRCLSDMPISSSAASGQLESLHPESQTDPVVIEWRFLALDASIILAAVGLIRGVMTLVDRRAQRGDCVSEEWLASHRRVEKPPDRA